MSQPHKLMREIHQIGHDTAERIVGPGAAPTLAARGICTVGLSDAGRGYRMARPAPTTAHLLICYDGAGRVLVDGHWQDCEPGMVYVSPRSAPMAFETVSPARWQFAWAYLQRNDLFPLGPAATLGRADPRQFVAAIEGLYRETTDAIPDAVLIDAWAGIVFAHAKRLVAPNRRHDPLWPLWATVDAALAEPWTLTRLAESAAMTEESLRRLCHQTCGQSPMRYVTELRMRRAEAILTGTPSKLESVARAVGYSNAFAFSAAFRRCKGTSPDEFRRATAH